MIPAVLAQNVTEAWREEGRQWLARLPELLADVARGWELTIGEPYELSYHWVTRATRADGTAAVLKLGVPGRHLRDQAEALAIWDGRGAVALLEADLERGALLLEAAEPGTPVSALVPEDDEAATATLIEAGRRLHVTPPEDCGVPALYDHEGESFAQHLHRFPGDGPVPRHLVEGAARLFEELCTSATTPVLLHADLHHDNVLRAQREPWLAIDPIAYVGDPGFDCGSMLYNPEPWRREEALLRLVPARIEQLSEWMPRERVVAWGFVMGVLSEVWTAQGDGTPGSRAQDVAELLSVRLS